MSMDSKELKRELEEIREQKKAHDRENILLRVVSLLVLALVISACLLFFKLFTPDEYDITLYTYNVDTSSMKDVTDKTDLTQEITDIINKYPDGPQRIEVVTHAYVNNRNGETQTHIDMRDDGICDYDKTAKVSYKTKRSTEKDIRFDNILDYPKMDVNKLNRLYQSAGGYIAIYNFNKRVGDLPELEFMNYVYLDSNKNKLAEIMVAKTLESHKYIYKTEIVYNAEVDE